MRPYGLIDLHCDTLTECKYTNTGYLDTLEDPGRVLRLSNMAEGVHWAQFYAVWIQDCYQRQEAMDFFRRSADNFDRQMKKFSNLGVPCQTMEEGEAAWAQGKRAAILTIEDGAVLGGRLENAAYVRSRGVRCMTIVWNGINEIGSGHSSESGLTDFGKQIIPEMERLGILVDISHLNDAGVKDLFEVAEKPFIATHSNARSVCAHKRNLTDDMIREMVRRDCLIGLNYFIKFLSDDWEHVTPDDFYRHICRFFELGAEKNLALGSDYDGCTLPEFFSSPEKVVENADYLLGRGLTEDQIQGIYWRNAYDFLKKNL